MDTLGPQTSSSNTAPSLNILQPAGNSSLQVADPSAAQGTSINQLQPAGSLTVQTDLTSQFEPKTSNSYQNLGIVIAVLISGMLLLAYRHWKKPR